MSDKDIKQAATAGDAAEPAKEKTMTAAKKPAKTDAAKTAVKVAETAAKVAKAAAQVAEAAAMVAESAKDAPAAKKPAVKKTDAEKAPAAKKTDAEKAPAVKKPDAEKAPAAKKPAAKKQDAPAKEVAATTDVAEVKTAKPAAKKAAAKTAEPVKTAAAPAKKYSQNGRYRLYARYKEEIIPALVSERGYKNVNQAPKLDKIVLNMRLGDVKDNSKSVQTAINELAQISGQKPIPCKAKKSVANFKVREGMVIGAKVTLRGLRAYEFLDKLISVALPRVRDFRGVSGKAFDGRGNYALGVKEQIIFPEISYELVEKLRGFDIAIITTAKTDDEAKALLTKMGMPFRN